MVDALRIVIKLKKVKADGLKLSKITKRQLTAIVGPSSITPWMMFSRVRWLKHQFFLMLDIAKQGCGSSDRFRNQQQLPFILFTTLNTARDFPTQNDSEFIIVSLTGRPHYKSRVVFRTVFSENHGHDAGIADFFLLVSCF